LRLVLPSGDDCAFVALLHRGSPLVAAPAICYTCQHEYDKAARFSKAIQLSPTAIHYQNRGMAYFHAGDYDKAIVDFGDAIGLAREMQPGRRERTGGRGSVYVRKGDYDKAQSDFNKAIHRRGPDFDSTAIEVATKLTQKYAFLVALCHGAWTACIRIAYAGNANLWLWTVSVCNFAQAPVSGDSRLT
jgi:tetratricopeptide (TPR) repeat protein